MPRRIHKMDKGSWPAATWNFPIIHNFEFGFGLSMENVLKASTIVPYAFQDNAMVDYETIKTNPHNADFAVRAYPNCLQGSYVPEITVGWKAFKPRTDTTVIDMNFNTLKIGTAFLNRLDASDKKTGGTIKTILELQSESTDEQTGPLWNGTKLYEGFGTYDYHANVPFLTGTQQPEGVAFDKELYFDANHYFTNKQMLKSVSSRMRTHYLVEPAAPHGRTLIRGGGTYQLNPLCKSMNEYCFHGELFHLPQVGSRTQLHLAADVTDIEHLTIVGFVRFLEYNPDINFARS